MSTEYRQAVLDVGDPQTFAGVQGAIQAAFSPGRLQDFLKSVERSRLRVRSFEAVLASGLLGTSTKSDYDRLSGSDQGQIREFYLASLERVEPEIRERFFKLYAYY